MIARALLIAGASAAAAFSAHASDDPDDVSAEPLRSRPPAYPAACEPASMDDAKRERVAVMYDVTRDGRPQNVRVRETSNPCFNDAAISAIRNWEFEPRRVNGRRRAQEDLETTFVFVLEEETQALTFDARPLKRVPPVYPEICMRRADNLETVIVSFTVTEEGETADIEIVDSTNRCLNSSAVRSVKKWLYAPKVLDGEVVRRPDVQTVITFQLGEGNPAARRIRGPFRRELSRIRRDLSKDGDPEQALVRLQEIEAKYGADFSQAETVEFYYMRGVTRIGLKDYRGALDDFRTVRRSGAINPDADETLAKYIIQLEATIAAQETPDVDADAASVEE